MTTPQPIPTPAEQLAALNKERAITAGRLGGAWIMVTLLAMVVLFSPIIYLVASRRSIEAEGLEEYLQYTSISVVVQILLLLSITAIAAWAAGNYTARNVLHHQYGPTFQGCLGIYLSILPAALLIVPVAMLSELGVAETISRMLDGFWKGILWAVLIGIFCLAPAMLGGLLYGFALLRIKNRLAGSLQKLEELPSEPPISPPHPFA